MSKHWWTLIWEGTTTPVVPFDENPGSYDEGMLVYRTQKAAQCACRHQRDLYDVQCKPIRLNEIERENHG